MEAALQWEQEHCIQNRDEYIAKGEGQETQNLYCTLAFEFKFSKITKVINYIISPKAKGIIFLGFFFTVKDLGIHDLKSHLQNTDCVYLPGTVATMFSVVDNIYILYLRKSW